MSLLLGYSAPSGNASVSNQGQKALAGTTRVINCGVVSKQASMASCYDSAGLSSHDISTATYANKSFLLTSQDNLPQGFTFSDDGKKLYVIGQTNKKVFQYTLSIPFDVSTASYSTKFLSLVTQDTLPWGLAFSTDGTKVYITGQTNQAVYRYDLGTAWDISTATFTNSYIFGVDAKKPRDIQFVDNGLILVVADYFAGQLVMFELTVAWDITTASFWASIWIAAGTPTGFSINPAGTRLYAIIHLTKSIYAYDIVGAPFDISNCVPTGKTYLLPQGAQPAGLRLTKDELKVYSIDQTGGNIYQYNVAVDTGNRVTSFQGQSGGVITSQTTSVTVNSKQGQKSLQSVSRTRSSTVGTAQGQCEQQVDTNRVLNGLSSSGQAQKERLYMSNAGASVSFQAQHIVVAGISVSTYPAVVIGGQCQKSTATGSRVVSSAVHSGQKQRSLGASQGVITGNINSSQTQMVHIGPYPGGMQGQKALISTFASQYALNNQPPDFKVVLRGGSFVHTQAVLANISTTRTEYLIPVYSAGTLYVRFDVLGIENYPEVGNASFVRTKHTEDSNEGGAAISGWYAISMPGAGVFRIHCSGFRDTAGLWTENTRSIAVQFSVRAASDSIFGTGLNTGVYFGVISKQSQFLRCEIPTSVSISSRQCSYSKVTAYPFVRSRQLSTIRIGVSYVLPPISICSNQASKVGVILNSKGIGSYNGVAGRFVSGYYYADAAAFDVFRPGDASLQVIYVIPSIVAMNTTGCSIGITFVTAEAARADFDIFLYSESDVAPTHRVSFAHMEVGQKTVYSLLSLIPGPPSNLTRIAVSVVSFRDALNATVTTPMTYSVLIGSGNAFLITDQNFYHDPYIQQHVHRQYQAQTSYSSYKLRYNFIGDVSPRTKAAEYRVRNAGVLRCVVEANKYVVIIIEGINAGRVRLTTSGLPNGDTVLKYYGIGDTILQGADDGELGAIRYYSGLEISLSGIIVGCVVAHWFDYVTSGEFFVEVIDLDDVFDSSHNVGVCIDSSQVQTLYYNRSDISRSRQTQQSKSEYISRLRCLGYIFHGYTGNTGGDFVLVPLGMGAYGVSGSKQAPTIFVCPSYSTSYNVTFSIVGVGRLSSTAYMHIRSLVPAHETGDGTYIAMKVITSGSRINTHSLTIPVNTVGLFQVTWVYSSLDNSDLPVVVNITSSDNRVFTNSETRCDCIITTYQHAKGLGSFSRRMQHTIISSVGQSHISDSWNMQLGVIQRIRSKQAQIGRGVFGNFAAGGAMFGGGISMITPEFVLRSGQTQVLFTLPPRTQRRVICTLLKFAPSPGFRCDYTGVNPQGMVTGSTGVSAWDWGGYSTVLFDRASCYYKLKDMTFGNASYTDDVTITITPTYGVNGFGGDAWVMSGYFPSWVGVSGQSQRPIGIYSQNSMIYVTTNSAQSCRSLGSVTLQIGCLGANTKQYQTGKSEAYSFQVASFALVRQGQKTLLDIMVPSTVDVVMLQTMSASMELLAVSNMEFRSYQVAGSLCEASLYRLVLIQSMQKSQTLAFMGSSIGSVVDSKNKSLTSVGLSRVYFISIEVSGTQSVAIECILEVNAVQATQQKQTSSVVAGVARKSWYSNSRQVTSSLGIMDGSLIVSIHSGQKESLGMQINLVPVKNVSIQGAQGLEIHGSAFGIYDCDVQLKQEVQVSIVLDRHIGSLSFETSSIQGAFIFGVRYIQGSCNSSVAQTGNISTFMGKHFDIKQAQSTSVYVDLTMVSLLSSGQVQKSLSSCNLNYNVASSSTQGSSISLQYFMFEVGGWINTNQKEQINMQVEAHKLCLLSGRQVVSIQTDLGVNIFTDVISLQKQRILFSEGGGASVYIFSAQGQRLVCKGAKVLAAVRRDRVEIDVDAEVRAIVYDNVLSMITEDVLIKLGSIHESGLTILEFDKVIIA